MRRFFAFVLILAGCATAPANPQEAELRKVETQLEELYGPLYFLIEESRLSVGDFLKFLKRDFIWPAGGQMPEGEFKALIFKAETDLMPRNDEVCRILKEKGHLAEGGAAPPTFAAMIEHQDGWKTIHAEWKKEGGAYDWNGKPPFPRLLGRDVKASYAKLKARRAELARSVPGAELRWVERQLDELHVPARRIATLAVPADPQEAARWLETRAWIPTVEKSRRLFLEKGFLLEGSELPAALLAFLDRFNSEKFFWFGGKALPEAIRPPRDPSAPAPADWMDQERRELEARRAKLRGGN